MKTEKCTLILKIFYAFLACILLFVLVVFVNHRIKTTQEMSLLEEQGYYNPVSVGDYCLNVAKFGNENGKHTIVGLAGLGSGDFSSSMRQTTTGLEKDNRIVFVDRAGYGLSDDTNNEMTLDYIVEDYRKALSNAGMTAPYVLMAHSIGGAYASYWVSHYPDEIEAVVLVDGSELSASAFEDEPDGKVTVGDRMLAFLAKVGFSRFVLRDYFYHYPDNYSEEEQALGDALTFRTLDSIAPVSESYLLKENAQAAFDSIIQNDVPKLYICASWGLQTKDDIIEYNIWINRQIEINKMNMPLRKTDYDDETIQEILKEYNDIREKELFPYIEAMGNCQLVYLPGDHMIYEMKPEACGKLIKEFVEGLSTY